MPITIVYTLQLYEHSISIWSQKFIFSSRLINRKMKNNNLPHILAIIGKWNFIPSGPFSHSRSHIVFSLHTSCCCFLQNLSWSLLQWTCKADGSIYLCCPETGVESWGSGLEVVAMKAVTLNFLSCTHAWLFFNNE